jgi:D-lactate dehydrogenase
MKVAIFSIHSFDKPYFELLKSSHHELFFFEEPLNKETYLLAKGCRAVALFTSDTANAEVLHLLRSIGIEFVALRSAGFDHVDLAAAAKLNIKVANVPEYSPHAIAEHAIAMMLTLNRKIIAADHRVKRHDFSLGGLTGFDLNDKMVGVIGSGKIGSAVIKILHGFGCRLLAYDREEREELKEKYCVQYTTLEHLCRHSDIITLHVPLNQHTRYLINEEQILWMKNGVMLINTARGAVVNTSAVIHGIKSGKIGFFGMDVYEHEKGIFFYDHSRAILQDDQLALLTTFSNVLITAHQAFLTHEALTGIAQTTMKNIDEWSRYGKSAHDLN